MDWKIIHVEYKLQDNRILGDEELQIITFYTHMGQDRHMGPKQRQKYKK